MNSLKVCCGERDCDGRSCNDECGEGDDFDCPKPNGFFEDPKNCMKYWQCNNDIAQHHSCDTREYTINNYTKGACIMAIWVVEFSNEGYKIRKAFA